MGKGVGVPLTSKREFIAAGNILDGYIRVLDARCGQRFAGAGHEGGDDGGVPSGMDYGDT